VTRVSILADEHVPSAVVTTLSSNGFDVVAVARQYAGTDDAGLLTIAAEDSRVLLTNDRDFITLANDQRHAGIVCYATTTPDPGDVARAFRRIDRLFDADALADELLWLDDWF
jgi:hypothetical protein